MFIALSGIRCRVVKELEVGDREIFKDTTWEAWKEWSAITRDSRQPKTLTTFKPVFLK
jgi:hypothetical protein